MSQKDPIPVIEALYDAALLPAKWPEALQSLAAACGGVGVAVSRGQIPEPALASPSLKDSTSEYAARWWRHDSRAPRLRSAYRGHPVTDADLLTVEERRHDPYYQEFLRPFGVENFAAVLLSPLPGMNLTVSLEGPTPFSRRELETFATLSRHMTRALAITTRIGLTEAFSRDLIIANENLNCGIISLKPEGQVNFTNDQAARMLGDGLTIQNELVCADAPQDQAILDSLIAGILSNSSHSAENVFIRRPSGKSPFVVQGIPVRRNDQTSLDRLGVGSSGGLLLIHDLAAECPRSIATDLQRMGLTGAQARVAELIGLGMSVKQAAEELGIVESTARVQLKAVFARLGISRQSELAILITKLGAVVAAPPLHTKTKGPPVL